MKLLGFLSAFGSITFVLLNTERILKFVTRNHESMVRVAPAAHDPRLRARKDGASLFRAQLRNPLPASWHGPVSL